MEDTGGHRGDDLVRELDWLLNQGDRPLKEVLDAILARPHRVLVYRDRLLPLGEVVEPEMERMLELANDPSAIGRAGVSPTHFRTPGGEYSFHVAWERQVEISHDTAPNAATLRLLDAMARLLRDLRHRGVEVGRLSWQVSRYRRALRELGVTPRPGPTQGGSVLELDPRYRRVRQAAARLRRLVG